MSLVSGVDPRTGLSLPPVAESTAIDDVAVLAAGAAAAATEMRHVSRRRRAELLNAIASRIESARETLVETAASETAFSLEKLNGEVTRAAGQFRFFAAVITEGSYLEATIDHAGDGRPDLRRMLVPVGPVAMFGSSNFPFAFSVLGGDTASALAAGNPVVVKAHHSHPATSQLSFAILEDVLRDIPGAVAIVYGTEAGAALVTDPHIAAVGFTGSLSGGQALLDLIATRPVPIPFYGELSSINPVVVTPGAARERGPAIGAELVRSLTTGAGQLCTKPGVFLVPAGAGGDELIAAARDGLTVADGLVLLNRTILASYTEATGELDDLPATRVLRGPRSEGAFGVEPVLTVTDIDDVELDDIVEIFGPVGHILRYEPASLRPVAERLFAELPGSLAVAIHVADDEAELAHDLSDSASRFAGRIVFDGFPTGVAVTWAQHHGGPWPSTNTIHTSVGASAIRRFLRPIAYQNAPASVLPSELAEGGGSIPRRIDGVLTLP